MNSLLQTGFWSKPNQFCFRRIQLQSPGSAPLMYWFNTILEFHDGIRNVRSRCILDKLSVVRIHVVVQEMVVDEVCQIFGVGVEFLRSQYRSLRHTAHYLSVFSRAGTPHLVSQKWGTVIPVYSWHTLSKRAQNTQKTAKDCTLCVYFEYINHSFF